MSLPPGPDGKRRRRSVYADDKASAIRKLHDAQADAGVVVPGQVVTLDVLLDRWLAAAKTRLKASSWARYDGVVRLHVRPVLGAYPLSNITALDIDRLVQAHAKDRPTARYVHAVLFRAMRQAVKWGFVAVNAAASTERIPQKRGEVQHWTEAQAKKFLRSIKGHRLEALFVLALSTGMREGELFALHWDQVDLKRRTIRVTHSQEDVNGHLVRGDVKTTKGRRLITLDPATAAILKGLPRTGDAVFCAAEGGPLRKSNFIRREWAPAVKAAGLPPMRFHGLRHTHATLLLAMGVHPKVVSERLGHASIALTLDTYSHAVPSMQAEAAAKMGRLLTAK